jgi:hypothetical protein
MTGAVSGGRLVCLTWAAALALLPGCRGWRERALHPEGSQARSMATTQPEVLDAQPATPPATQPDAAQPAGSGLAQALRAARLGEWVYERRESWENGSEPPVEYVRRHTPERILEGKLTGQIAHAVGAYLLRPAEEQAAQRPRLAKPHSGSLFLFELRQPIPAVPDDLEPHQPATDSTPVRYYNYEGRLLSDGTLRRTAEWEATEAVDTPAGRFADCCRVRVDFTLTMPWLLTLEWNSYLWLSPAVGEVRRVQHMAGWFLILPFASTHEYRLVRGRTSASAAADVAELPIAWQAGAVLLDSAVPKPVVGGMVVDLRREARNAAKRGEARSEK